MKNEIRVYAIRAEDLDFDKEYLSDFSDVPDSFIVENAMNSGMVWTLKGFERAFNEGNCSDQWIIRILTL